jgi:hypothetical protein
LRGEPITPLLFNYFTNINQSNLLKNGKKSKVSAGHFRFPRTSSTEASGKADAAS